MVPYQVELNQSAYAARASGAELRRDIEAAVANGQKVVIHFSAVECVSEAWADEVFGVLVRNESLVWLRGKIAFRGVVPAVAETIAAALRRRITPEEREGLLGAQRR